MTLDLSRANLAKPTRTDAETGEDVYVYARSYGSEEFRVPAGTPVRRQDSRWSLLYNHHDRDPRRAFPNAEVSDGALVIPVCDMVDVLVSRTEPATLAREMWTNEEVRQEFVDQMVTGYTSGAVTDADRRRWLHGVREAVHSRALNEAVAKMVSLEHDMREKGRQFYSLDAYSRHYQKVLDTVAGLAGAKVVTELQEECGEHYLGHEADSEDFQIGRRHWNESRGYWRAKLEKLFPPPVEPTPDVGEEAP